MWTAQERLAIAENHIRMIKQYIANERPTGWELWDARRDLFNARYDRKQALAALRVEEAS